MNGFTTTMIPFKLLTAVTSILLLIALVPTEGYKNDGGVPCDENGLCKYGGKCGPSNTCVCQLACSVEKWGATIYCGISKRRKYYLNLCQLQAHACELQMDIPIIKMDMKNPSKKRCKVEKKASFKLCSRPEDFMGPCGGSLVSNSGAGICLEEKQSGVKRCVCPNDKTGHNCQARLLSVRSVARSPETIGKPYVGDVAESGLTQIIVFGVVCAMLFVVFTALLIKRFSFRRTSRTGNETHSHSVTDTKDVCVELRSQTRYSPSRFNSSTVTVYPGKVINLQSTNIPMKTAQTNSRRERIKGLSSAQSALKPHNTSKSQELPPQCAHYPQLVRSATT